MQTSIMLPPLSSILQPYFEIIWAVEENVLPSFQNWSKIYQKLAKHSIFAIFKITKKLPKIYTKKITISMPIAPRSGAIRVTFVIFVYIFGNFLVILRNAKNGMFG